MSLPPSPTSTTLLHPYMYLLKSVQLLRKIFFENLNNKNVPCIPHANCRMKSLIAQSKLTYHSCNIRLVATSHCVDIRFQYSQCGSLRCITNSTVQFSTCHTVDNVFIGFSAFVVVGLFAWLAVILMPASVGKATN